MESKHSEGATFFHANLKTGTAYPEDLIPHEDELMHIPNTRSIDMVPLPAVPLPRTRALSSTGYRQVLLSDIFSCYMLRPEITSMSNFMGILF